MTQDTVGGYGVERSGTEPPGDLLPAAAKAIDLNQCDRLSRQKPLQQILRPKLQKTRRCAVRTCVEGAFGDGAVHHQMYPFRLREDGAQNRRRPHLNPREFPELFRRCERDARDAQGSAEVAGDEGFVVGGDVEVEFRLLAVAHEDGFDDADANLGVDVLAVFHRQARVRVHALEGNVHRHKRLIDLLLEFRGVGRGRCGEDIANFEHSRPAHRRTGVGPE